MSGETQKENDFPDTKSMPDQPEDRVTPVPEDATKPSSRRNVSSIGFPYLSLEDAESGAKAVYSHAGTSSLTQPQAASAMNLSNTSSAFRGRLAAMKMFGLLEYDQGRVQLTDLGRSIADPHTALGARVTAFLRVPLYERYAGQHDGHMVPKPQALNAEFIGYGVSSTQVDRARQAFERSAKYAGFIKPGTGRFVQPHVATKGETPDGDDNTHQQSSEKSDQRGTSSGDGGGGELDPVIRALVMKIPPPGSPWGIEEQVMWLKMMAMALSMAYGGKRSIKIEVEPESPARL